MKEILERKAKENESGVKRKTLEDIVESHRSSENKLLEQDVANISEIKALISDVNPGQVNTDGKASVSLTSSLTSFTNATTRLATAAEIRSAKWRTMKAVAKKGYVQIQTSMGNINLEIHCDIAMQASWNFITLCDRGYYDDTIIHRYFLNIYIALHSL